MRHAPAFATRLEFGRRRLVETNISVAALSSGQILPHSENMNGSSVKELRSNGFTTNVGVDVGVASWVCCGRAFCHKIPYKFRLFQSVASQ